ncbi:MAG: archease [Bacteroidota bacterium]|nr:archease [Bacteroidota bacterium]
MFSYNLVDHTADIAFEVSADTIEELFIGAALAWKNSVTDDFETVKPEKKDIFIYEDTLEELLVSFVSELNFQLSARKWIFHSIQKLTIDEGNGKGRIHLKATVSGEALSVHHNIKEEIKAVTFHQMSIEKRDNQLVTIIVFDI